MREGLREERMGREGREELRGRGSGMGKGRR